MSESMKYDLKLAYETNRGLAMNGIEITVCDEYIDSVITTTLQGNNIEENSEVGCLALPSPYNDDEYYYAQETIDFVKYFKEVCNEVSIAVLANGDIEVRSLHSFDIFMPIIWVVQNVALPAVVGIVSSYIYDRLKGREAEDANVEVSFVVDRDGEKKMIHYKGPAREFAERFKDIDLNKL